MTREPKHFESLSDFLSGSEQRDGVLLERAATSDDLAPLMTLEGKDNLIVVLDSEGSIVDLTPRDEDPDDLFPDVPEIAPDIKPTVHSRKRTADWIEKVQKHMQQSE